MRKRNTKNKNVVKYVKKNSMACLMKMKITAGFVIIVITQRNTEMRRIVSLI